jgi:hypothetical protein
MLMAPVRKRHREIAPNAQSPGDLSVNDQQSRTDLEVCHHERGDEPEGLSSLKHGSHSQLTESRLWHRLVSLCVKVT